MCIYMYIYTYVYIYMHARLHTSADVSYRAPNITCQTNTQDMHETPQ